MRFEPRRPSRPQVIGTAPRGSRNVVVTDSSDASGTLIPDTAQATYGWSADACADFNSVLEGPACQSDWVYLTVEEDQQQQLTLTVTPCTGNPPDPLNSAQVNLSTGDTNKCVTTTLSPSTIQYTPAFPFGFTADYYSNCSGPVNLGFSAGTGQGSVNSTVTAGPAGVLPQGCSGVFAVTATANTAVSNNSAQVVVPPQALISQLHAEAYGFSNNPSLDPQQVAQKSVGMTDINRFFYASNPYLFGGVSTFQALAASGLVAQDGTTNGPPHVIDNAAEVYSGQIQDPTAGSTCYWSPNDSETTIINQALASGQTTFPSGTNAPECWCANTPNCTYAQPQIVIRLSMPLNTLPGKTNSPAFMFLRSRPVGPGIGPIYQVP